MSTTTAHDPGASDPQDAWHLDVPLIGGEGKGAWTYAALPDSAAVLGHRGTLKVQAAVDGVDVAVTLLPLGDGTHMFPMKAATRRAIGKEAGDVVTLRIDR